MSKLQRFQEALDVAADALGAAVRLYGNLGRDTLNTRTHLAKITWDSGDTEKALVVLTEALGQYRTVFGNANSRTLVVMVILAQWFVDVGKRREAQALLDEALSGMRRMRHHKLGVTLSTLASLQEKDGSFAEALATYEELGAVRELNAHETKRVGVIRARLG